MYYYITDQTGTAVWTADITPFGDKSDTTGPFEEAVKYTGKDLDTDTGLYYFNARWYDSDTGRFISEDPIKDGLNWYVYASNNPLIYMDPTGLLTENKDYSCTIDKPTDTPSLAAQTQGYNSWQDSLTHYKDNKGNYVDISDRLNKDGSWKKGAKSLLGLSLEYNPENMDIWTAEFMGAGGEFSIGMFDPDLDTSLAGDISGVKIQNTRTLETFNSIMGTYTNSIDSLGAAAGFNLIGSKLYGKFPKNISINDINKTLTGNLEVKYFNLLLGGFSKSSSVHWKGYGGNLGLKGMAINWGKITTKTTPIGNPILNLNARKRIMHDFSSALGEGYSSGFTGAFGRISFSEAWKKAESQRIQSAKRVYDGLFK